MKNENMNLKAFAKYVTANVMGMIGLSCYILADTFFIAQGIGSNGLAALNLAIAVYSFINGIGLMIGVGAATGYAIAKARGEKKEGDRIFTHAVGMGLVLGCMLLLVGIFLSDRICVALGADEVILPIADAYLKTMLCFSPCFIMNNIMIAFIRNDGAPRLSMTGMLLGSLSNIILDYIFIFPLGLGMFGAAFATGIAPIVSMGIMSLHIIKKKNGFSLRKVCLQAGLVRKICGLGLSAFIGEAASGITVIVFNLVILRLAGNVGVAAYGVVINLALVAVSIYTGIAQGMQPLVSRFYGLGNGKGMKQMYRYAVTAGLCISVILYTVIYINAQWLTGVFNSERNGQLQSFAVQGMRIYFIGFFFAGINIITATYMGAVEQIKRSFLISVMRGFLVMLPLLLLLSSLWEMLGVWRTFPCAEAVTFIASVVCMAMPMKK